MNIEQRIVEQGISPFDPMLEMKLGLSSGVREGSGEVIHGMRCAPEKGTSGWYVWAGEYSYDSSFFEPVHGQHLANDRPDLKPLLHLPPGWRFLFHGEDLDIWFDEDLLND